MYFHVPGGSSSFATGIKGRVGRNEEGKNFKHATFSNALKRINVGAKCNEGGLNIFLC